VFPVAVIKPTTSISTLTSRPTSTNTQWRS
jgi:hypothetical protein